MEAQDLKNIPLPNGKGTMPAVGLGCWQIPNDQAADTVYEAIKLGYRCIDQAIHYGNEKEVGNGIKRALDEGIVKREELFITSKLWNTCHRKEHVPICFQRSLDDLQCGYLDLYLIHFPISLKYVPFDEVYPPTWPKDVNDWSKGMEEDPVPVQETWKAMEDLYEGGKIKNIGVSNFPIALMRDILSYCKYKPVVNQVEIHPYNTQEVLVKYCKENGIAITAFSAMGAISYGMGSESPLHDPRVAEIAAAKGKDCGQILMRFAVQRGIAVIPKSMKSERLASNIALFDWELDEVDMKKLLDMNKNARYNNPLVFAMRDFGHFYPIYD